MYVLCAYAYVRVYESACERERVSVCMWGVSGFFLLVCYEHVFSCV